MKKFLTVLFFAVAAFAQTTINDTTASTPTRAGYIKHDTIPAIATPTDQSWMLLNLKRGDRIELKVKRAKATGTYKNSTFYAVNDFCSGTDAKNYKCIVSHTSIAARKPITGAVWSTYWVQTTSPVLDTISYVLKDTTDLNDFDIKINVDYMGKKHNYDSIP